MKSDEFRECFKMILSLAIVPIDNLKIEIEKLKNYINQKASLNEISSFYNEFIDLYCKDINNESNLQTVFSVHFWYIYDRVLNKIPKTTNVLEGWHRSLNNNFQIAHPNIYEFGIELKKRHAIVENKINQLFLENNETHYTECDELIEKIINYDSYPGLQYLKIMASLPKIKYQN
ncbi:hypothetical protein DMUE_3950 [Dictyocoela muelleri]|nr:hypothetical protein DMUE_3950 [Dictyocoela muelleri]